jgi:hypothetical protein
MPKNVNKYDDERNDIISKLFNILGINDMNITVSLHDLDTNKIKQNQIIELVLDIKKYFICSKWSCFRKPAESIGRYYLSIIKNLIKNMNYNIFAKRTHLRDINNIAYCDTIYHIIKNK